MTSLASYVPMVGELIYGLLVAMPLKLVLGIDVL